jgi:hypothetical protein
MGTGGDEEATARRAPGVRSYNSAAVGPLLRLRDRRFGASRRTFSVIWKLLVGVEEFGRFGWGPTLGTDPVN